MSGKKHKRELKRQKELLRQQQMQEERRRTLITMGIVSLVLLIGLGLVWSTVSADRRAAAAAACGSTKPDAADRQKPQFDEAPQMTLRDGDYTAVIETSCGTVEVDLYEDKAPTTVNNFVALAAVGFYDGLQVFRNAPSIFALQTGAATNEGSYQVGYTFADELAAAQEEGYKAGSLAMANSGPNTNGSQFFFTYGDSTLEPNYSKFGQVTEGLDVLEEIGAIPVEGEAPEERIFIDSVTILLDGKDLKEILEEQGAGESGDDDESEDGEGAADGSETPSAGEPAEPDASETTAAPSEAATTPSEEES